MRNESNTPNLITYEVSYENARGHTSSALVSAQGYQPDEQLAGWLAFWRYLAAGYRQTIASFPIDSLSSIVEADMDRVTVPEAWTHKVTVPPPSDDDVPF